MHSLRVEVLRQRGGGKTVSRKARSRPSAILGSATPSPKGSPAHSKIASPDNSRPGSRYGSDVESVGSVADDSTLSSVSDYYDPESESANDWRDLLRTHVDVLKDRKHNDTKSRETALAAYVYLTRHNFANNEIGKGEIAIIEALIKALGGSPLEQAFALKALSVTLLTAPSTTAFANIKQRLMTMIEETEDFKTKIDAINALSVAVLYGGGGDDDTRDILNYLIEMVRTDGESANASDSGPVVTAAMFAWAFLSTFVEDLDDLGDGVNDAVDIFVDQLDSNEVDVQVQAGTNIALIYEASRVRESDDGEPYNIQYDPKALVTKLQGLMRQSAKRTSKRSRQQRKNEFTGVITSLERGVGPSYSTALSGKLDEEDRWDVQASNELGKAREYGYRNKIKIGHDMFTITTWHLLVRVDMLRTILSDGYLIHFKENIVAEDILKQAQLERYKPETEHGEDSSEDEDDDENDD